MHLQDPGDQCHRSREDDGQSAGMTVGSDDAGDRGECDGEETDVRQRREHMAREAHDEIIGERADDVHCSEHHEEARERSSR